MYLHKEETLNREEIEKLQLERLQKTVQHCMNSAFYKKRFEENGLTPDDIQSLDDLKKIPFTTKQDLRDNYPFGIASVPLEKAVRLHSSSGTTGKPKIIVHSDCSATSSVKSLSYSDLPVEPQKNILDALPPWIAYALGQAILYPLTIDS